MNNTEDGPMVRALIKVQNAAQRYLGEKLTNDMLYLLQNKINDIMYEEFPDGLTTARVEYPKDNKLNITFETLDSYAYSSTDSILSFDVNPIKPDVSLPQAPWNF